MQLEGRRLQSNLLNRDVPSVPIQKRTLALSENTRAPDARCADSDANTSVARVVSSVISLPLSFGRFEDALKIAVESLA
jgi:hypothetical protein